MSYALVGDRYHSDPKFMSLSKDGISLWWALVSWTADHKTNGYLRRRDLEMLARQWSVRLKTIDELAAIPEGYDFPFLVLETDGLYRIHEDEKGRKKTSTERVKRFRQRQREQAGVNAETPNVTAPATRFETANEPDGTPSRADAHVRAHTEPEPEPEPSIAPPTPSRPEASERMAELMTGCEKFMGRTLSGLEVKAAERLCLEAPRMTVTDILRRMDDYRGWREQHGKQPLRRLDIYVDQAIKQDRWLADQGVPAMRQPSGFSRLGASLEGGRA